jgi:DNA repair protein RadD
MSLAQLRPYQQETIDSLRNHFRSGGGNALIVVPCGGGKTWCIAGLLHDLISRKPNLRALVVSPRRELVTQTLEKLETSLPGVSVGVVAASLGRKERTSQIVVGTIHSLFRSPEALGLIHLLVVDEAQWVPPGGEGMFRTLISGLREKNPSLTVVGYTATPFRTSTGALLGDGGIWQEVACEVPMRRLLAEGYLSRLTTKAPRSAVAVREVRIRAGEFVEEDLDRLFNQVSVTARALAEAEDLAKGRKSWVVFCCSREHAENVTNMLHERGVEAECVLGDTPGIFREQAIERFRRGELRALVGCQVFTEGFDAPNVDCVVLLRATNSPGLYAQMVGRGQRKHTGKENCLVLDFGGNIERHGPVDAIRLRRRWNPRTETRDAEIVSERVKTCAACLEVVTVGTRECPGCGLEFPAPAIRHERESSEENILSDEAPRSVWRKVSSVEYGAHEKNSRRSLRVRHHVERERESEPNEISEWVCLEHEGFARAKAVKWWGERGGERPFPATVEEALRRSGELREPTEILTQREGRYWRVVAWRRTEEALRAREAEEQAREELFAEGVNL